MSLPEDSYGRAKRFEFISAIIRDHSPRQILDIGCGTGTQLTILDLTPPEPPELLDVPELLPAEEEEENAVDPEFLALVEEEARAEEKTVSVATMPSLTWPGSVHSSV